MANEPTKTPVTPMTYGVALELAEINSGDQTVRGVVHLDTPPLLKKGEEITVSFSHKEAQWAKIETSLKKGQAAPVKGVAEKSIIVLENAYRDENGKIIARWARTARSALKALQDGTLHDRRKVMPAWVSEPVLAFKNPNPTADDPDYVMWPLTATSLSTLDRTGQVREYNKEWLVSRLEEARRIVDIPVSVYLRSFTLKSPMVTQDTDVNEVRAALTASLEQGDGAVVMYLDASKPRSRWFHPPKEGKSIQEAVESGLAALPKNALNGLRFVPVTQIYFGTDSTTAILDAVVKGAGCPKGIQFLFVPRGASTDAVQEPPPPGVRTKVAPALLTVSEEVTESGQDRYYIQTSDLVKYLPMPARTIASVAYPALARAAAAQRKAAAATPSVSAGMSA